MQMTRPSNDSSFVQLAAWPFANQNFWSSVDNLYETEAANWTASTLYNAPTMHWKAAAQSNEQ